MKTNIPVLALVIGLSAGALAQTAPPGGIPPAVPVIPVQINNGQSQAAAPPNANQINGTPPDVATNNPIPANTNWSSNTNGNSEVTPGTGMTNLIKGNPYATYTNPYYTYAQTNVTYVNPRWSNDNPNTPAANVNWTNTTANHHHWWSW